MNNFLTNIFQYVTERKLTLGLAAVILLLLVGGFLGYRQLFAPKGPEKLEEIDLAFDPEGPYALLTPRRDGNAAILNIKRISSYEAFSYALIYTDEEGIERGTGDLSTWIKIENKQSDYEQEILFGTCSKNVCKYDKGVENGTLILRIKQGNKAYRMLSQWHLQKPDVALGVLTSGDGHFKYETDAKRENLVVIGYSIVNDLTAVPKLPEGKKVFGKVYSVNVPVAKEFPEGKAELELVEKPASGAKLARFDEGENKWIEYETKVEGSKLSASVNGAGIFAALITAEN